VCRVHVKILIPHTSNDLSCHDGRRCVRRADSGTSHGRVGFVNRLTNHCKGGKAKEQSNFRTLGRRPDSKRSVRREMSMVRASTQVTNVQVFRMSLHGSILGARKLFLVMKAWRIFSSQVTLLEIPTRFLG
jgi:hypothetical protein